MYLRIAFFLVTLCSAPFGGCFGQSFQGYYQSVQSAEAVLTSAEAMLERHHYDNALALLQDSLGKDPTQVFWPLQLRHRIQLATSSGLFQKANSEKAVILLKNLLISTRSSGHWEACIQANLQLARLRESLNQYDRMRDHLYAAGTVFRQKGLSDYRAEHAMLLARYHDARGLHDSVDYHLDVAISNIDQRQASRLLTEIYLAAGDNAAYYDIERALQFSLAAEQQALAIKNDFLLAKAYRNIISSVANGGMPRELVIHHVDKLMTLYKRTPVKTPFWQKIMAESLLHKQKAFKYLERYDSAFHYVKITSRLELLALRQRENEKVVAAEKRYELKEKNERLERQAIELRAGRLRNAIVIALTLAMGGLVLLVLYFYRRLQKISRYNEQQTEELRRLDGIKSRFFANISHELRTPLTLLLGPIHTILKRKNNIEPESKVLLELAAQGGENLKQLVNDILDLAKMEQGEMALNQQPTAPASFFRQNFAQFESLAREKNIDYRFQLTSTEHLIALLDREKCRRIIFNLLSNAFKFTPEGGTVSVALSVSEAILSLEVTDTGKGIDPDDLPHIFNRYFQTKRSDAVASGGTGIGLALCAEYAELLGGKLTVESEYGKGASFKLWFPLEPVTEDPVRAEGLVEHPPGQLAVPGQFPPPAGTPEERPTVLIVEDNRDLQTFLRTILERRYQLIIANNGEEACSFLWPTNEASAGRIDLILSDLMMPVMDGYQLLQRTKKDAATQGIPFIMLTARAAREDRLKALRIGVDDYLAKPFDETELELRISNLLVNQRARRAAQDKWETAAERPQLSMPDQEWLEAFEEYVRNHLADQQRLSVTSLALTFNLSESSLLRQVKRLTGLSPKKYLTEIRLAIAREWLEERRYASVGRVGAEVGYTDVRSFSRSFRRRYGKLPSEIMG